MSGLPEGAGGGFVGGILGLIVSVATWKSDLETLRKEHRENSAQITLLLNEKRSLRLDMDHLLDHLKIPRLRNPPATTEPKA